MSSRDESLILRIDPIPGSDVIRDLIVDHWALERKRESTRPWMVAATREGIQTPQGVIGSMEQSTALRIHSLANFDSAPLLHSSSDAVPYANGFLGPAVLASAWARRNDQEPPLRGLPRLIPLSAQRTELGQRLIYPRFSAETVIQNLYPRDYWRQGPKQSKTMLSTESWASMYGGIAGPSKAVVR